MPVIIYYEKMNWREKSNMIEKMTYLEKKESQALSIKQSDESSNIYDNIKENEDSVNVEELNSAEKRIDEKKPCFERTSNVLDDINKLRLPILIDEDFNKKLTIHFSFGTIGSGRTTAGCYNAILLDQKDIVDEIQAVSPVHGEWDQVIEESDVTVYYPQRTKNVRQNMLNKILECIESYDKNNNCVLFVDHAHNILGENSYEKISEKVQQSEAKISLRLIGQSFRQIKRSKYDADVYNMYRKTMSEITEEYDVPKPPQKLHTGTDDEPWSEVIHINKSDKESKLRCVYER